MTQADISPVDLRRRYTRADDLQSILESFESSDSQEAWDSVDWFSLNKALEDRSGEAAQEAEDVSDDLKQKVMNGGTLSIRPSEFVRQFLVVDRAPFSYVGREYLRGLYDPVTQYPDGCRNILLIAGRQVEKTLGKRAWVLMASGAWKQAQDVEVGDELVTMDERPFTTTTRKVTWKSEFYEKPTVTITTRQGHKATFGHEHPLFRSGKWVKAEDIRVDDRIAVVRRIDCPVAPYAEKDIALAKALGWLVSEGGVYTSQTNFYNSDPAAIEDFISALRDALPNIPEVISSIYSRKNNEKGKVVRLHPEAATRLQEHLPVGTSFTHRVPPWIYTQGKEVRAAFINRIWGGDGHVSIQTKSKYEISYCSVNRQLCRDLQALLWSFGIPTSLRSFTPTLYKETDKLAWQIRVETQEGVNTFLEEIGAFGKTEGVPRIVTESNNNRDTLPKEAIQEEVYRVCDASSVNLHAYNLRRTLKYPPTKGKLLGYIEAFDDAGLAHTLTKWLSQDIYWDEVESIEVGEDECVDFSIDEHHNFIVEGFITHNSTSQTAKSIALGAVHESYKTLYVAPRYEQLRVFSQQRFKPMCEDSEAMSFWVKPSRTLWQVTSREFVNGSFFNFRSCFLSADSARGITCENLLIDEIQDIISDAIPVLEECQAHASDERRQRMYAGTPKSTANVISRRWNHSCQFEWLIRCAGCNHWNFPDDEIVADDAFRCVRCRKELNMRIGQWVPQRPEMLDVCWGFRIPQLIVPFQTHKKIYAKRNDPNYSTQRYFNECLGLPYDDGTLVLTEGAMRAACSETRGMTPFHELRDMARRNVPIFCGVDYGSAEGDNPSYTVIALGYPAGDKFKIAYLRRFVGKDSDLSKQPAMISQIANETSVKWGGFDWGFGAAQNSALVSTHGWNRTTFDARDRVLLEFMYTTQKALATYDTKAGRYHIDRNKIIELIIHKIKTQQIEFFKFDEFKPFMPDFTGIFVEYNEQKNTYKYDHSVPDDCFHAITYAYLSYLQFSGQLVSGLIPRLDI